MECVGATAVQALPGTFWDLPLPPGPIKTKAEPSSQSGMRTPGRNSSSSQVPESECDAGFKEHWRSCLLLEGAQHTLHSMSSHGSSTYSYTGSRRCSAVHATGSRHVAAGPASGRGSCSGVATGQGDVGAGVEGAALVLTPMQVRQVLITAA
jgi:hypothetical protein